MNFRQIQQKANRPFKKLLAIEKRNGEKVGEKEKSI